MIFLLSIIFVMIPTLLFFPTKFIHKERFPKRGKKAIITSNHYSNFDSIIYDSYFFRKFRFLSKIELYKNKLLGFYLKRMGCIPIDRENFSAKSYKTIISELNKNHQVFIFPEGTRNKSGSEEMLDIHSGAILFASRSGSAITPMIMYRKPKFLRKNYVIIGEPFEIIGENHKKLSKIEMQENITRYQSILSELRAELNDYVETRSKKHKKHLQNGKK